MEEGEAIAPGGSEGNKENQEMLRMLTAAEWERVSLLGVRQRFDTVGESMREKSVP
jgi:hypothetical protein